MTEKFNCYWEKAMDMALNKNYLREGHLYEYIITIISSFLLKER